MMISEYPKRLVAPTINTSSEQYQYQQPYQILSRIHHQLPNVKLCAPKINTCSIVEQTRKRSYEQTNSNIEQTHLYKQPRKTIIYESYDSHGYNPFIKQNVKEKIDLNFMKELDHVYNSLGVNDEVLKILSK